MTAETEYDNNSVIYSAVIYSVIQNMFEFLYNLGA